MSQLPAFNGCSRVGSVGWADLRSECDRIGSPFFAPATMRFFRSRTVGQPRWVRCPVTGRDLVAFITSEQDDRAWEGKRRYSVRGFDPSTGRISHIGSHFGQFRSAAGARSYINSFNLI